jgi:transposase
MSKIRFVGLDVHAETIAVAVAEPGGEIRSLGIIPNRLESVRKMISKLGPVSVLKCCYEAGPTGYVLYWQLTQLGVACEVIAPTLVPVKAGDRVKTDRRDAENLVRWNTQIQSTQRNRPRIRVCIMRWRVPGGNGPAGWLPGWA